MVYRGIAQVFKLKATSVWSLDYRPLFAWLEFGLSQVAAIFDKQMLVVEHLEYDSDAALYFQRSTVLFLEIILVYSLSR